MNVETKFDWNGEEVKVRGKRFAAASAFDIGLVVEGQAKVLTPIDSGRLRGSITTQATNRGSALTLKAQPQDKIEPPRTEDEVLVGTAVEYGPYIEFGTIRHNAQPFLRPALDLAQGKALTIVMREGRAEFKEYLK